MDQIAGLKIQMMNRRKLARKGLEFTLMVVGKPA